MEEYYPSEIARLVLGYLKEVNCTESWKTFLAESSDLAEHNKLHQLGKTHTTNVDGKSLLDILREYCNYTRGSSRNANLSQSNSINSDGDVFRTPLKGNQLCFTKHKIYQKSRTQQVTASPRCEQSSTRLAARIISVSSSPNSAPSPKTCGPSVRATALNFNRNAQSSTNEGLTNDSEDFSANRRSYSFNYSPVRNSVPLSSRTTHSDPIRKSQPKKNQTVQTDTFSRVDSAQNATAASVKTKQFSATSSSHNSSLHEIREENVNSDYDHQSLNSDSHPEKNSLAEVNSILEPSEKTNPVSSLQNVDQNAQSFGFNERVIYQASEITSTNKNFTITTLESSLTPQNFFEPPAYSRAPNTNSPRLILSDERSQVASLTTPQKHRSFEDFYAAASPRRKGFIPRRRLLSGSPGPNQLQNDSVPLLNTLLQDLSSSEVELEFARALAEGINASYPNMQVINESQDITTNGLDPKVLDKCLDFLNNLLTDGSSANDCNDTDLKTSDCSKQKQPNLDSQEEVVNKTSYDNLNLPLIQSNNYLNTNAPDCSADNEQNNQNSNLMNNVISNPCINVSRNEEKMLDSTSSLCATLESTELNSEILVNSTNIQMDTDNNNEDIRVENSPTEMNSEILKQMDGTSSIDHQNSCVDKTVCDSANDFDKDKINNFFNNVEKDLSMHVNKNSSEIQNFSFASSSVGTTVLLNGDLNSNNGSSHNERIILPKSNQITLNTTVSAGNTVPASVSLVAQPASNIVQASSLLPTQTIFLPPVPIENFQNNLQYQFVVNPEFLLQVPSGSPTIAFHQAPVAPLPQPVSQDYCLSTLNSAIVDKSNLNSVANYVTISPAKLGEVLKRPTKSSLKNTKKVKQSNRCRKKAQPRKTSSNKTAPAAEPVTRNLRPRKKQDLSDLFSSPSPISSPPAPKTPKQRKTNKATESKTYEEPRRISIAEPSPSNRSALELLSEVTGENEIQTPQLRTLLSCVSDLVRKGDRLKSPCVRNLNFEPCDKTPEVSPIQRRSSNRARNATTKCSCDASPPKSIKTPESNKTVSPVHKRKQSPGGTSSNVETQSRNDAGSNQATKILRDEIVQPLEKAIGGKDSMVNTHEEEITIELSSDSPNSIDLLSMPSVGKNRETAGEAFDASKRNQSLTRTSSDIESQEINDASSILAETVLSEEIVQPLPKPITEKENFMNTHEEAITIELSGDSPNNINLLPVPNLSKSNETVEKSFNEATSSLQPKNSLNNDNQKHLSTPNANHLKRDLYFPSSESESENEHDLKQSSPCSSQSSRITVVEISVDEEVVDTSESEVIEESLLNRSEVITIPETVELTDPEVRKSCDISLLADENSKILLCQQEVQQKETEQKKPDAVDSEFKADTYVVAQEENKSLVTSFEDSNEGSALEQTLVPNDDESGSTLSLENSFPETSIVKESPVKKISEQDTISSVQKNSDNTALSNVSAAQTNANKNANGESKIKDKICTLNKMSKLKTPEKNSGETLHSIVENIVSKKRNAVDLMAQNNLKNSASQAISRKSASPRRILAPPKKRIRPVTISSPNDRTYHPNSPFFPFESRCPKDLAQSASSDIQDVTQKDASASVIPSKNNSNETMPKAESPVKIHFHSSPLSKKLTRTPAVYDLSPANDTENITLKELAVNILPIEKRTSQLKTPQKFPFHSTPLSGKPKAMAEFYRNLSKSQSSAFPISPGSVSSSSCTLDTFIAKQKAHQENSISSESRIESPVKNSCDSEKHDNSTKKRKLKDEPNVSILMLPSSPQSKTVSLETSGDSCSPIRSAKRKSRDILLSSPEASSLHSPSKNDLRNSTIFIDNSLNPQKSSLDQQSPVKSFLENKQANKSHLSKKTEQNPHIPAGVKIPSKWKYSNISNYSADILKFSKKNKSSKHASFRSRLKVSALKSIKKGVKWNDIVKTNNVTEKKIARRKNDVDNNKMDGVVEISPESCSSPELPTVEQIFKEKVAQKSPKVLKKEVRITSSGKDNCLKSDETVSSQKTLSSHTPLKKRKLVVTSPKKNVLEKHRKSSPTKAWMPHDKKQKIMNKKSLNKTVTSKRSGSNILKQNKKIEKASSPNCSKESGTNSLQKKQSTPEKNKMAAKANSSPKSNNLTLPKSKELDLCSPGSRKRHKASNQQSLKETNRNDAMKVNESAKSIQDLIKTNEKPKSAEIGEPSTENRTSLKNVVDYPMEDFKLLDNRHNINVSRKLEERSSLNQSVSDNSTAMKNNAMEIGLFHDFEVCDEELPEEKQPVSNESVAEESISCNTNLHTKHPVRTYSLSNRHNFSQPAKDNTTEDSLSNIKSVLNLFENIHLKTARSEKCDISKTPSNELSEKISPINSPLENKELPLEKTSISTHSNANEANTSESTKTTWHKAIGSVLESTEFDECRESYKALPLGKPPILKPVKSNKTISSKRKKVSFSDECDTSISPKKASVTDRSKVRHKKIDKILKATSSKKRQKMYSLKSDTTSKQNLSKDKKIEGKTKFNVTEKDISDNLIKEIMNHTVEREYQNNKKGASRDSGSGSSFKKKCSTYHSSSSKKIADRPRSFNDLKKSKKAYIPKNTSNNSSFTISKESKESISNMSKDSSRDSSLKIDSVVCHSIPNQQKADKMTKNIVTNEKEKDFSLKNNVFQKSSLLEQHKTDEVSNPNAGKKSGQENETNSSIFSKNHKKTDDTVSLKPNRKSELTRNTISDHLVSKEAAENLVRISQAELCLKESESAIALNEHDEELFDTQPLERTEEDENEIAQAIAFLHDSQKENSLESRCKSHGKVSVSKFDESPHQSETEKFNVNKIVQKSPVNKNNKFKEPRTEKCSKLKEGIHSRTLSTNPSDNEYDSGTSRSGNSDGVSAKTSNEASANEVKDEKLKLLLEKINQIGVDNLLSMLQ